MHDYLILTLKQEAFSQLQVCIHSLYFRKLVEQGDNGVCFDLDLQESFVYFHLGFSVFLNVSKNIMHMSCQDPHGD